MKDNLSRKYNLSGFCINNNDRDLLRQSFEAYVIDAVVSHQLSEKGTVDSSVVSQSSRPSVGQTQV